MFSESRYHLLHEFVQPRSSNLSGMPCETSPTVFSAPLLTAHLNCPVRVLRYTASLREPVRSIVSPSNDNSAVWQRASCGFRAATAHRSNRDLRLNTRRLVFGHPLRTGRLQGLVTVNAPWTSAPATLKDFPSATIGAPDGNQSSDKRPSRSVYDWSRVRLSGAPDLV